MASGGKEFFLKRYRQLGYEYKPARPLPSLRVNTLRIKETVLVQRLGKLGVQLEKIPFTNQGYFTKSKFSLGAIQEYLLGYYYLQGSASQLPVEVLEPKPGELVLDCCAAPGGKTTQIAQLMKNKGTIIALDMKLHRIPALKVNLERMHITNTIAYHLNANKAAQLGMQFDKILLDAPCSGNFASDPTWFEKRTIDGVRRSSEMQKSLLKNALSVLKKDGILVYSTCTLEPEENEMNIDWLLKNFNVALEKVDTIGIPGLTKVFGKKLNSEIAKCRRFWPDKTEGFFIARIRKC